MGLGVAPLLAAIAVATPIPDPAPTTLPHYQGAPARARVFPATKAPQNPQPAPPGTNPYQDFAGGGYFFLDAADRIWSATRTGHLVVLHISRDGRAIRQVRDYDL